MCLTKSTCEGASLRARHGGEADARQKCVEQSSVQGEEDLESLGLEEAADVLASRKSAVAELEGMKVQWE